MRIITGKRRGLKLNSIEGLETRPTESRIKESIFNILGNVSDSIVLDLFSGTGNIGLEFLSRGAKEVYLVDSSKKAIDVISSNVKKVNLDGAIVLKSDYYEALKKFSNIHFDYIYIDPPYKSIEIYENALKFICDSNNFKNALIIVEADKSLMINNLEKFKIIDKRLYRSTIIYFLKEE